MSKSKKPTPPDESITLYDRLVATNPAIQRKGAANPYTSLNGHMFSYLHPSRGMALRLPPDAREEFLTKYNSTLFEAYGVVQREYVAVPDSLLRNTRQLQKYFEMSYRYVHNMKPKASKRR
jgi:hypothetical protein